MQNNMSFSKSEFEKFLSDLGKECKKTFGRNTEIEIVIVGGASVVFNYNFRSSSIDIDSLYIGVSDSTMKEVINKVADKNNLPSDWINNDFKNTVSYSPKLVAHSDYYKTYGNGCLVVRTVKNEYLIAMKLQSDRDYKHDLSDILGIIIETPNINIEKIDNAIIELYGSENHTVKDKYLFLEKCFEKNVDFSKVRDEVLKLEDNNYKLALENQSDRDIPEINFENVIEKIVETEQYENTPNEIFDEFDDNDPIE